MHHFTFPVAAIEGLRRWGWLNTFCKSHNFWNFTHFSLGYIEERGCNFWSYESIFYQISRDDRKDITNVSEHIHCSYGHFAVFGQKCGFCTKIISSLKNTVFYRIKSNRFRKHSLKIWAWSHHFSRFHRYWKFKIQRNKSELCKTFFEEYI